jgi:hypothetical protein
VQTEVEDVLVVELVISYVSVRLRSKDSHSGAGARANKKKKSSHPFGCDVARAKETDLSDVGRRGGLGGAKRNQGQENDHNSDTKKDQCHNETRTPLPLDRRSHDVSVVSPNARTLFRIQNVVGKGLPRIEHARAQSPSAQPGFVGVSPPRR